jgi:hypothetical protein
LFGILLFVAREARQLARCLILGSSVEQRLHGRTDQGQESFLRHAVAGLHREAVEQRGEMVAQRFDIGAGPQFPVKRRPA